MAVLHLVDPSFSIAFALLWSAFIVDAGCSDRAWYDIGWSSVGKFPFDLQELSGVAASRQYSNILYLIEDSGNDAVIYVVNASNAEVVNQISLVDVVNDDWEDISISRCQGEWAGSGDDYCIFVGDIGNNKDPSSEISIIQIKEPSFDGVSNLQYFSNESGVLYVNQSFWYPSGETPDAEAIVAFGGSIYIFTKREDGSAEIWVGNLTTPGDLQKVGTISEESWELGGGVSGADISADGKYLAILVRPTQLQPVFQYELTVPGNPTKRMAADIIPPPWNPPILAAEAIAYEYNTASSEPPSLYVTGERLWSNLRKLDCGFQDPDIEAFADLCPCLSEIPMGPSVCQNGVLVRSICEANCMQRSSVFHVCSADPWPPCTCLPFPDANNENFPLRITEACSKHCLPGSDFVELENIGTSTYTIKRENIVQGEVKNGQSSLATIGDNQLDHSTLLSCQDKSVDIEPQGRIILSLAENDDDRHHPYFQSLDNSSFCFLPSPFGLGGKDSLVLSLVSKSSWDITQIVGWPSDFAGSDKSFGRSWGLREPLENYFGPLPVSTPAEPNGYFVDAETFPMNAGLKISEVGFLRYPNNSDDDNKTNDDFTYSIAYIEVSNLASAPVYLGHVDFVVEVAGSSLTFYCPNSTIPSGGIIAYFAAEGQFCSEIISQTSKLGPVETGIKINIKMEVDLSLQRNATMSIDTNFNNVDEEVISYCQEQDPLGAEFVQKVQLCQYPTPGLINTSPKSVAQAFLPKSVLDMLVSPGTKFESPPLVPESPATEASEPPSEMNSPIQPNSPTIVPPGNHPPPPISSAFQNNNGRKSGKSRGALIWIFSSLGFVCIALVAAVVVRRHRLNHNYQEVSNAEENEKLFELAESSKPASSDVGQSI